MKTTLKSCLILLVCGIFALPAVAQEDDFEATKLEIGAMFMQSNKDSLLKRLNLAIEKYPKEPNFLVMRAIAYTDMLRLAQNRFSTMPHQGYYLAIKDLEMAIKLNNNSLESILALAGFHYMHQQFEDVLKVAQKGEKMALEQENQEMYHQFRMTILTALYHTGKMKEAKAYALSLAEEASTFPDVYSALGMYYGEINEFDKSFEWFDKGIKTVFKEQDLIMLQVNYAYICTKAGKYEKALEICNELLKNKTDIMVTAPLSYCYNNRGYAQMSLGKLKEAEQDINTSLKYYPENSYSFRNRGLLYLKMGKKDLACADFKQAEAYGFSKSYGDEVLKLLAEHCR